MSKTISMVDLNSDTGATASETPVEALDEIKEELPTAEAVDIDTDELESLLIDLKATKKKNKMPAKKRERKQKVAAPALVEDTPVVVEPVVETPVVEEPEVEVEAPQVKAKPKRKYVRKPQKPVDEPQTPHANPVPEPAKRTTGTMIEEMQRAERALRYQMRKNKMQTLITQAF